MKRKEISFGTALSVSLYSWLGTITENIFSIFSLPHAGGDAFLFRNATRNRLLPLAVLMARVAFPVKTQAQFHGFLIGSSDSPAIAHSGDSIVSFGHIVNADQNNGVGDSIIVTNAYQVIYYYDNAIAGCPLRITNLINLAPFSSNNIVTDACLGIDQTLFGIKLPAQGSDIFVTNIWTVACDAPGYGFTIPYLFVVEAIDTRDQDAYSCPLSSSIGGENEIRVTVPCISCSMSCTNGLGENGTITYGGAVLNCGNHTLINIFLENNLPTNHTPVLGPISLPPGESANFAGSFPGAIGPAIDTITVRCQEAPVAQLVVRYLTNTCSVTCSNIPAPTIFAFGANGGSIFSLSFETVTNQTYSVQFTDSLFPINWHILTNLAGDGGLATIRDNITNAQRFYRALVQ